MEGQAPNPLLLPPDLTPLEQEVLEEYERLAENMKKVSSAHAFTRQLISYLITCTRACKPTYVTCYTYFPVQS